VIGGQPGGSGASQEAFVYDPATESWASLPASGAPAPRYEPFVVCTTTGLLVWGGRDANGNALSSGGVFDIASAKWRSISAVGAPSARSAPADRGGWGAFSGQRVALVGGLDDSGQIALDGGSYDPAADAWTPLPAWTSGVQHDGGSAVYTGRELLLWGGSNGATPSSSGDRLHP
jgi:hypothetical protein